MKQYLVKYSTPEGWVSFSIMGANIYEALDWVHEDVQETGTCIEGVDLW